MSRTLNTRRNMISALIRQGTNIILPFITRTLILYLLGAEYQGLNGLFTSVLHVLNLADLGFASAVTFALYEPIAKNDYEKINALAQFLKQTYRIVALIILGLGIAISPFLPVIISGSHPTDINIYVLFYIYLANTVISYLLSAYRSSLLAAYQRQDITSNVATFTSILLRVLQIVILLATHNYYLYVIALPVTTILNNIGIYFFSKRLFPQVVPSGKLLPETKEKLTIQIKGVVINKLCDTARNSLDNIIISTLIGLTAVAIYDNYYYIYSAVYAVALAITRAMQGSVGNSIAVESTEKNYYDLKKFSFVFMIIVGWCSITMACLYQPFMTIWMRNDRTMMLSNGNMLLFCLYFYLINMNNTRNLYLNGKGLYWECRISYVCEAIGNLLLNIILGKLFGITGVIIATIVTIFAFNFLQRTNIVFKKYFNKSTGEFYKLHLYWFVVTLLVGVITFFACSFVNLSGVGGIAIRLIVTITLPGILYFLIYRNSSFYKESLFLIKKLIKR